jgi:dienelactone hydrolase
MSRAHAVFWAAIAMIAVHVVDDSFVNPEPGTSASDHLVSGLVPLAALGLAGWAFGRVRDGVRAVMSLVLGLFGVVASAEGWYEVTNGVGRGDDYTGLLALPAGAVLLLLAIALLWRSRRRGPSRARAIVRRTALVGGGLVILVYVVVPFMMSYPYTHISRANVPANELGDVEFADVSFETSDGLELRGWYLPSRNGAAVIAFAGRTHAQDAARFLHDAGYGVLLYDRRGEAASEGDPHALGWDRASDVEAGISFLKEQPDVDPERIGGIGFSVGGEMLLEAAATSDDLKAVVSEGAGIRSVKEGWEQDGVQRWLELPVWTATTAGAALFSDSTPPANLKDLVPRISPRPILFIYAESGQGGEHLTEEYYAVAGEPKELWQTPSSHVGGYDADPEEYARRVTAFFDQALLP